VLPAAGLALVLVVAMVAGWRLTRPAPAPARPAAACAGLDALAGAGFALSMIDGECIGWTDEQPFEFSAADPAVTTVMDRIAEENRAVALRWSAPAGGVPPVPYVRVAALMPMTGDQTSAMTGPTILHALQGLYAAQRRANDPALQAFRAATPGIQVVLANEGRDQTRWPPVVDQLAGLAADRDHPLVAAVGLGISTPQTQAAVTELTRRGIPSVGAVITATNLTAGRFFKVSPANTDYAAALRRWVTGYLATRPNPATTAGYLVADDNDDNYVQTLREALLGAFGATYRLDRRITRFAGSKKPATAQPGLFAPAVDNICATQADLVFFAGRDRDLPALVTALAQRHRCGHDKPVTVLTGATGLDGVQSAPDVLDTLTAADITLVDASATDPRGWAAGRYPPDGYAAFHAYAVGTLHLTEDDLDDGYAIMHHDALATVAWATRLSAEQLPAGALPRSGEVALGLTNLHGTEQVQLAGGTLSFWAVTHDSPGWPEGKPVPIFELPPRPGADPAAPPYLTQGP
jgi:hypothetical protein